jgi:arylsulfatase A-like enzyme
MFTGFLSSVHGVQREGDQLSPRAVTLAELLKKAGYCTAAFAPNPSLSRRFGFDQGFDLYDDRILKKRGGEAWQRFETASEIHRRALLFVEKNAGCPFFLYLHYRDVHGPYVPPPDYRELFWRQEDRGRCEPLTEQQVAARPGYLLLADGVECLDYYLSQYDASIRYTDDQILQTLSRLEELGILEESWLVLTADHGESFLERGLWNHGNDLYEEEIHVPLIVVPPREFESRVRVVEEVVQGTDLFPTLLEMAGIRAPFPVQGRSLLPLLQGMRSLGPRITSSDGWKRLAVRQGRWKLMWSGQRRTLALYDLDSDSHERRDVNNVYPGVSSRLRFRMKGLMAASATLATRFPRLTAAVDEDLARELRALGYLE